MKKTWILFIGMASFIACRNSSQSGGEKTGTDSTFMVNHYQLDSVVMKSSHVVKLEGMSDTTVARVIYPVFSQPDINDFLRKQVLSYYSKEDSIYSYKNIVESFIQGYDEFSTEQKDRVQSWYLYVDIEVLSAQPGYLAFKYTHADYAGGAHGNEVMLYLNYDPVQKKSLQLKDLLLPGKMDELTRLAEQIFRKNEQLSPQQSLTDQYFFENGQFSLPENFYLREDGIVFLYNAYEIKPYVAGTTTLVLPFDKVKPLIQPSTIKIIQQLHAGI